MSRRKVMAVRHPGGSIKQKPSELMSPAEVRRLAEQASLGLRDAVWSTQLGRIYLAGKVSASEFSAGKHFSELTANYSSACQSPLPPRTPLLERANQHAADPDSEKGLREVRRHERATAQFLAGRHALRTAGPGAERVVEAVVVRGEAPAGQVEFNALRAGLCALSTWWQSTRRKR